MKYISLLIAIVFASNIVFSQDTKTDKQKTPEQKAQMKADQMKTKLDLSEKQRDQVYQLTLTEEKALEIERLAKKERKLKNEASLKKILTPDQYKKLEKNRLEKRGNNQNLKSKVGNSDPIPKTRQVTK
jgi:Spy/CpxP family protein refolding chaperone